MIKFFVFFIFLSNFAFANQPPAKETFDQSLNLFLEKKFSHYSIVGRAHRVNRDFQSDRQELALGLRGRLTDNFRTGGEFVLARGLRHNEDWNFDTGRWKWRQTEGRQEELFRWFLQHKFSLVGNGIGIWKTRLTYQRNFFNKQDLAILKAGLIWLGIPKWTTLHQIEAHIPLNFHRSVMSELWLYNGFVYRFNNTLALGPSLNLGAFFWNESIRFRNQMNTGFTDQLLTLDIGLNLIIRI